MGGVRSYDPYQLRHFIEIPRKHGLQSLDRNPGAADSVDVGVRTSDSTSGQGHADCHPIECFGGTMPGHVANLWPSLGSVCSSPRQQNRCA